MKRFIEHAMLREAVSRGTLPEIFLDGDGVVADFDKGAAKAMDRPFGGRLDNNKITQDDWGVIMKTPKFWLNLPVLSDGIRVYKFIKKYRINILSAAPGGYPGAAEEKTKWVKKHLGSISGKVHIVKRADKIKFAIANGIPNILIDDFDKNIREWETAGGIGIHHTSAKMTIKRLKELGF